MEDKCIMHKPYRNGFAQQTLADGLRQNFQLNCAQHGKRRVDLGQHPVRTVTIAAEAKFLHADRTITTPWILRVLWYDRSLWFSNIHARNLVCTYHQMCGYALSQTRRPTISTHLINFSEQIVNPAALRLLVLWRWGRGVWSVLVALVAIATGICTAISYSALRTISRDSVYGIAYHEFATRNMQIIVMCRKVLHGERICFISVSWQLCYSVSSCKYNVLLICSRQKKRYRSIEFMNKYNNTIPCMQIGFLLNMFSVELFFIIFIYLYIIFQGTGYLSHL